MKKHLGWSVFVFLATFLVAGAVASAADPAWKAKYNTSAPGCTYGGEFKSIEALDQYTVKFTLCTPDPAFLSKVAFVAFSIQSAAYLEKTGGGGADLLSKPIGTGPYMVKEWVRGDHLTFVPNPYYWGEKPKNSQVIFRWNKEAAARLLELQAGTVDAIANPSPDDFDKIQANPKLKLMPVAPLNVLYLGMNNTIKPFDNEKVRQAVAMAIDKKRLITNFYPSGSMVAEQFMPPALVPGYSKDYKWYPTDTAAAKKLLAEAGYPDGFETTLSYRDVVRNYLPLPGKVAQDIQSQLAAIGIKVKINVLESGKFLASVAAGEQPLYFNGWRADYPDATNFVDFHFTGASKNFGTPYPDLVDAIRKAAQVADPAERDKMYVKVNELIKQHVPMVPLAHGGSGLGFKAAVQGAHTRVVGSPVFSELSIPGQDKIVWLQNAEPISLYLNDETDGETNAAGEQIFKSLLQYKLTSAEVEGALAEKYSVNKDLTEWTFNLRKGVKFSDGTPFDANDVVLTYVVAWDAKHPLHKGNSGAFEYFGGFFGKMLNAPEKK
jgi:peptide/nickel transport system substrate-binding protein